MALDQPTTIQEVKNQAKKYIQREKMLKNAKRSVEKKWSGKSEEHNKMQKDRSNYRKSVKRTKNKSEEHFTPLK